MSTHNLCFEQKHKKTSVFLSENFQFLEVKFSIYLNRGVFVMKRSKIKCSIFLKNGQFLSKKDLIKNDI